MRVFLVNKINNTFKSLYFSKQTVKINANWPKKTKKIKILRQLSGRTKIY